MYLGDLVEDVLVIPKLEANRLSLDPKLFDLGELIEDVAALVFPSGGRKAAVVSLPDGVRVLADRRRTQQVLRNVMENARKYGGEQVLVEGFVLGDQYLIVISDNGPGVPDEETQKVFEAFEQLSKGDARDSSGMGLGLPIARRLARAMGGDVWYERRFPTGARFCYLAAPESSGSAARPQHGPRPLSPPRHRNARPEPDDLADPVITTM